MDFYSKLLSYLPAASLLLFFLSFTTGQTKPVRPKPSQGVLPPILYPTNYVQPAEVADEALAKIEGWQKIRLGMDYTNVAELIEKAYPWLEPKDELFPDILEDAYLSEIAIYPNDYFERFHLQFNEKGLLYLIQIKYARDKYSYLSLLKKLKDKYGKPQVLNIKEARWHEGEKVLILERNRSIKYLDKAALPEDKRKISRIIEALEKQTREKMLEDL